MTKRLLLTLAVVTGVPAADAPANAGQGTEQLLGAYDFLREARSRLVVLQHGDFATFRCRRH
jgi:hypothetical protein